MDGQAQQTAPLAAVESEDRKLLKKALTRLRAALDYIPSGEAHDKEFAALSSLIREVGRKTH